MYNNVPVQLSKENNPVFVYAPNGSACSQPILLLQASALSED